MTRLIMMIIIACTLTGCASLPVKQPSEKAIIAEMSQGRGCVGVGKSVDPGDRSARIEAQLKASLDYKEKCSTCKGQDCPSSMKRLTEVRVVDGVTYAIAY